MCLASLTAIANSGAEYSPPPSVISVSMACPDGATTSRTKAVKVLQVSDFLVMPYTYFALVL